MIIIKKQYEIEEPIKLVDENENILYEFKMQLTDEDVDQLENALFGEDIIKLAKKIKEMENKTLTEEEEAKIIEMGKELNSTAEDLIEKLCFKDHKDEFIRLGGVSKYNETKALIGDYLTNFFMKRQVSRINTINSDLAKISQN